MAKPEQLFGKTSQALTGRYAAVSYLIPHDTVPANDRGYHDYCISHR